MNFQTKRLTVGPIRPKDKEAVLDLLTSKIVAKTYMLPPYQSRVEAEPLFRRLMELSADESRFVSGVFLDDRFIGMMNDTQVQGTQVEMGYAYLPEYYNRGYATEALSGAIPYLFSHGFNSVLAGAFAENPASLRVMEKCGMTRQDYTEQIEYCGVNHTCIYYAITKT